MTFTHYVFTLSTLLIMFTFDVNRRNVYYHCHERVSEVRENYINGQVRLLHITERMVIYTVFTSVY